jgi:rRNA maturation RNase YbeY
LIAFFSEDTEFKPSSRKQLRDWTIKVIKREGYQPGAINFIFCSKKYLLPLNQTYLSHNYHTDVITFDQSEENTQIAGDIYVGVEQVVENAQSFNQDFEQELKRVMIHGILHLMGYNDKTSEEKEEMRKKEEAYLSL